MTHTPYEQILSSNTKDDLVALRDFFGVEIPKNKRKEDIKEAILKRFHEDPVKVLWNLPTYELLLLSDLAREGKGGYIDYPETEFVLFSGMFDMLDVLFPEENESSDEDIMRLSFNDDIYDWFAPHIDEALKLQDKTMRRDFEHFFWGCLTLYGVLTEQEFLGLIEQHYEGMLAAPFYANLHRFAAFDYCFEFYEGRNYLCHPAVQDDLPQILENREKRGQAKSKLKQLPLDDILTAGATAPYSCCLVNKPQGKNLFQLLLSNV